MGELSAILRKKNIQFFPSDRMTLDHYYYEPFQDDKEKFDAKVIFEENRTDKPRCIEPYKHGSLFRFFLDGSRRTYKIGDIITPDNKFVPLVAGQIGAACCVRTEDKSLKKHRIALKHVLMLYSSINESDYKEIKEALENTKHRGLHIAIDRYTFRRDMFDVPTNAAVAKIQSMMQDSEVQMLTEMVSERTLSTDKMLIIDGSLQFLKQKFDPTIFYNVIGISKSFDPSKTGILKGSKQIGVLLPKLRFGERTPVYRYNIFKNSALRHTIGAWYLRIRDARNVRNPLEGVIKIERMAMQEDIDRDGFESDLIDNISASVLAERNPTCHGSDSRWPNHLYPIYLTEKLLKASFLRDEHFVNIF